MAIVGRTASQLRNYRMTRAQIARLDAMTDEEITKAARSDPDLVDMMMVAVDPADARGHAHKRKSPSAQRAQPITSPSVHSRFSIMRVVMPRTKPSPRRKCLSTPR